MWRYFEPGLDGVMLSDGPLAVYSHPHKFILDNADAKFNRNYLYNVGRDEGRLKLRYQLWQKSAVQTLIFKLNHNKAVIWTDVLQSGVLVFSLAAVSGKLWMEIGAERIMIDVKVNY